MTRARQRLYLTFGEHYEGGRRWRESRFLKELGARRGGIVEKTIPPALAAPVVRHANGHVGEVVLSYSAIAAYRDCPRQYWYRHVQRLPVVQSAEAAHGVILHEVLRQAGDLRRQGKPVTRSTLRSIHDAVWSATSFPDPRRAPAFRRNGAAELEAYRVRGGFDEFPRTSSSHSTSRSTAGSCAA